MNVKREIMKTYCNCIEWI